MIFNFQPTDLKMFGVCVCVEWRTEGQQAAAGLSVSNWFDQNGCAESCQLYPRSGNSLLMSTHTERKLVLPRILWNLLKSVTIFSLSSLCSPVQHPLLCTALQAAAVYRLQAAGGGGLSLSRRVETATVPAPDEWRGADPRDRPAQTPRSDLHLSD